MFCAAVALFFRPCSPSGYTTRMYSVNNVSSPATFLSPMSVDDALADELDELLLLLLECSPCYTKKWGILIRSDKHRMKGRGIYISLTGDVHLHNLKTCSLMFTTSAISSSDPGAGKLRSLMLLRRRYIQN